MTIFKNYTYIITIALAFLTAGPPASRANNACALRAGPVRAVVAVLDGETLRLDDGSEVRLAAILAPRTPDPGIADAQWRPASLARKALQRMTIGRSVRLKFDRERRDRYGRVIAHLFVTGGDTEKWIQANMVGAGHARVFTHVKNRACANTLLRLEKKARAKRLGLWSNAAYNVQRSADVHGLTRLRHTFQIIEGRVFDVKRVRNRTYINFSKHWKSDFTIVVEGRNHRLFEALPGGLAALVRKKIRVRGWIQSWNGPLIRMTHPEQLEVLPRASKKTPRGRKKQPRKRPGKEKGPAPSAPDQISL